MIRSIRLQNFRSHKDSIFEFKNGTNVIVGAMGSGKSSIMDGLSYGIFGTFPSLSSRKVSGDETILSKPNKPDFSQVEIEFDYNGKQFRVERKLFMGKKASEAKLYCNEKLVAGPKPSEVNKTIERELDVTYDLFSRAAYSEQNQLDFFLKLTPQERKIKFDELLQIDKYETARQNSQTLSNRLILRLQDQKKWVLEQQNQLDETGSAGFEQKIREKKDELAKNEHAHFELSQKVRRLQNTLNENEKNEQMFKTISQNRVRLETRVQEYGKQQKRLLEKTGNATLATLKEKEAVLKKQLERAAVSEKNAEHELEITNEQHQKLQTKIQLLENEVLREQKTLREIISLGGQCPTCQKKLDDTHKLELKTQSENRQAACQTRLGELKRELLETSQKKTAAKKQFDQNQADQTRLQAEQTALQHAFNELTQALETENALKASRHQLDQLNARLAELGFDESAYKQTRTVFLEQQSKLFSLTEQLRAGQQILAGLEQQLALIQKTRDALEKTKIQIGERNQTVEKLQLFSGSLKTVQALLRQNMLLAVNAAMADIWPRIYPYRDFSSAHLSVVENGNYELAVQTREGEWLRVEGILSGGERSAAALCIRMAFSLVLTQNLGWLILDEPTHNLDSAAVRELSATLKNHVPELVPQLFIITHDNEMQKAASGTLYRIERDKEQNGVSQPVSLAIE